MAANPSIQLGTDGNWAIKEDNLLAYKKDGDRFFNKEFDFTRGSLATFVDKDGLIKYSGVTDTELVTNGNFDTDSDWTLGAGWSISDGKVIRTAQSGSTSAYQNVSFSGGKIYKIQYDLDISDGSFKIRISGGALVDTPVRSTSGTYTEYIVANSGNNILNLRANDGAFVGSIDNVSVVEIQTDVPRIDFTDDATGHLLLEPQRTNLIQYSNSFDDSYWSKGTNGSGTMTITNDDAISPDGTQNADKVTVTGGAGNSQYLYRNQTEAVSSGATYTGSLYLKGSGTIDLILRYGGGLQGSLTKRITLSSNWERTTITLTSTGSASNAEFFLQSQSGATSNDFHIYAAQLEQGSYATSYIPTSGSTVTRNADVCNNSGSVQDFNSTEGVLYAEIAALANDGTFRVLGFDDNTSANSVSIYYRTNDNRITFRLISQGSQVIFEHFDVGNALEFHKVAFKYKSGQSNVYIDGVLKNTYSTTSMPVGLKNLVFEENINGLNFYGKTKNLKVFKRAMSDSELYLLTVPQYQSYQEMATALNYTL